MLLTLWFLSFHWKSVHETDTAHQGWLWKEPQPDSDENETADHDYFAHTVSQEHQKCFLKGVSSTQPRATETVTTSTKVADSAAQLARL